MKESIVLLLKLTPTCTELARHLVLSGINLAILWKDNTVTQEDIESDFLFCHSDIGQNVRNQIKNKTNIEVWCCKNETRINEPIC